MQRDMIHDQIAETSSLTKVLAVWHTDWPWVALGWHRLAHTGTDWQLPWPFNLPLLGAARLLIIPVAV